MIRNIISNSRIVGIRSRLELDKTKNILPRVNSSTLQLSFAALSTKPSPPPALAEEIDQWKQSLDDETKNRLFEIKVELSTFLESGEKVCNPDVVTVKQWKHILTLPSENARKREYNWIGRKSCLKVTDKEKQNERRIQGSKIKEIVLKKRSENEHIIYGMGHTALVTGILKKTINANNDIRLIRAKQFQEQKVIFDCSYDQYMNPKAARYTAGHLTRAYMDNRKNLQPFDLHIHNSNRTSETMKEIEKRMPNLHDPNFTIEVHDECFTDLYPRENLVYLTPESKNLLSDYNGRDIYVVPAVVDTGLKGPITMARPKQLQIRTAWFPINHYLSWGPGSKHLPLDIIIKILLDFKNKRNWKEAFKHIPDRKLNRQRHVRQELVDVFNVKSYIASTASDNGKHIEKNIDIGASTGNPFKIE